MKNINKIAGVCLVLLFCFLHLNALTGEDVVEKQKARSNMFFGVDDNQIRRYAFYAGGSILPHLYYESSLMSLSYIAHDPLNKNKKNFSLYQVFNPALYGGLVYELLVPSQPQKETSSREPIVFPAWLILPAAGNIELYYTFGESQSDFNMSNETAYKWKLKPSLLLKNNVDWFMLRKHGWLSVNPGSGLRLYIGNPFAGITATVGYQRSYQIDFRNKPTYQDIRFLEVGLDLDINVADGV